MNENTRHVNVSDTEATSNDNPNPDTPKPEAFDIAIAALDDTEAILRLKACHADAADGTPEVGVSEISGCG